MSENFAAFLYLVSGVLFILARVLFGHLPDRLGGTRVALLSVVVEALGLLLSAIWEVSPGEMSAQQTPETRAQFARYQQLLINKVRALAPTTTLLAAKAALSRGSLW